MILGITGGSGSGKSTLLQLLKDAGAFILDCDAIYHGLLQTDKAMLSAIESRFPGVMADGKLDRKKLGSIVFADPAALRDLNRITHSAVKDEVIRQLATVTFPGECLQGFQGADQSVFCKHCAIDAIGLFEGGLAQLCDCTVAITAPLEQRVQRLMVRDGISAAYARSRIAAQPTDAEFSARCDYTLDNNGTKEDFQTKCLAFLREIGII